jgi:hypothetical protein
MPSLALAAATARCCSNARRTGCAGTRRATESEALAHGRLSSADIAAVAKEARATLDRALEFAKASPEPDAAELLRDVYA